VAPSASGEDRPRTRRVLQAAPRAIGSKETFWIVRGQEAEPSQRRTATLKRIGAYAYVYVDDGGVSPTGPQLDSLLGEFERQIYPRLAPGFGVPPRPGVDGDDRIFLVLSPVVNDYGRAKLLGYFYPGDVMPEPMYAGPSNHKEVIFMVDRIFEYPRLDAYGTLAHEYQHLLHCEAKSVPRGFQVIQDRWLNEGMSMIAMDLAGYGLPDQSPLSGGHAAAFLKEPEAYSLTDWESNPEGSGYGMDYLFLRYLVDRYGAELLTELLASDQKGVASLETALAPRGTTLKQVFRDWAITLLGPGTAPDDPIFRYTTIDLTGRYGGFRLPAIAPHAARGGSIELALRPWSFAYYQIGRSSGQPWRLDVAAGFPALIGAGLAR
jgi:hypothetical protein